MAATAKRKGGRKRRSPSPDRPFPRVTIEQALRVPTVIKDKNAGNPWDPEDVARAVGLGAKGNQFYYVTAGSRDHGFTLGTRDATKIELTALGKTAVYPSNRWEMKNALVRAFLQIDAYRKVFNHYKGSNLPEREFLSNTLQKEFGLDPRVHEDFINLFQRNCEFVGIHTTADLNVRSPETLDSDSDGPVTVTIATPDEASDLLCFVIMPFRERHENHPEGYFSEVLSSLIVPAATEAGFNVRSAQRSGSDVIQRTIVKDLLSADLVVADLTEHNPNVMFELGMRMREDKPVAIIREVGTDSVFDVDNMLRVYDYDGRLWPTTIEQDLPSLHDHIRATWENREEDKSYMELLSG